ncbi:uncharacterized protein [Diadema setosum]|uniref:uncharacterized protein n=1 Tax=Diadema setosum TaxID=31175 RepID=UPI003B3A8499
MSECYVVLIGGGDGMGAEDHLLEVRLDVENQPELQPHIPPITKPQHASSNEEVAPDFDDDVAGPSRGQPSVAAVAGPSRDQPPAATMAVAGPSRGQPPAAVVAGPSSSSVHVGGSSTVASKKRAADAIPARDAPLPTHHITKVSQKHVRKYNANVTDYTVSFQPIENSVPIINMMPRVNEMFENIIEEMVQGVNDRDFVRLVFNTPQLDRPVSMPFVRRDQLNHEAFATKLENTIQSNEEVTLDENVSFNIIHMAMPNGCGSSKRCLSIDDMLLRKRCIIRMKMQTTCAALGP